MKLVFSLDQQLLSTALSLVQNICSRKTALDATNDVLFVVNEAHEVVLRVTDLEICLQFVLPAFVVVREQTSFLVNAKRLFDFVKDLSLQVKFSYDGSRLFVNYGDDLLQEDPNFHLSLLTADPSTFPSFPERIENIFNLDANFLQFALEKTTSLIPQSAANSAINGLFVEFDEKGASFVSTNGHSLILINNQNFKASQRFSWTLPRKSALELKKLVDALCADSLNQSTPTLFFGVCSGYLVVSGENFTFFTRLIAEPFPNYKAALNYSEFSKGKLSFSNLVPVLRRVGYLLSGKFLPANFAFANSRLKISFSNPDSGSFSESIAFCELGKFDVAASFYSPYLLSAASAFENNEVDFFVNQSSPIFFTHDFELGSLLYLIMPVVDQN